MCLHVCATTKICCKTQFFVVKAKKCCKYSAAISNWFDIAAEYLQQFFAAKDQLAAMFYVWATCEIFLAHSLQHFFAAIA